MDANCQILELCYLRFKIVDGNSVNLEAKPFTVCQLNEDEEKFNCKPAEYKATELRRYYERGIGGTNSGAWINTDWIGFYEDMEVSATLTTTYPETDSRKDINSRKNIN